MTCSWSTRPLTSLSSTISTRTPLRSATGTGDEQVCSSGGKANVNQKVEPSPTWLSTPISPPMSPISCFEIANPNPVPPNLRVMEASAWLNFSNINAISSWAIPMPVSFTDTRMCACCASWRSHSTATRTCPLGVNLMALPTRFVTTCRIRPASPTKRELSVEDGPRRSERGRSLADLHSPDSFGGGVSRPQESAGRAAHFSSQRDARGHAHFSVWAGLSSVDLDCEDSARSGHAHLVGAGPPDAEDAPGVYGRSPHHRESHLADSRCLFP